MGKLCVLAAALMFGQVPVAAQLLPLERALERAAARATLEEARLAVARGQLAVAHSVAKSRLDLRPQLGPLAFSNPVLLALNLGASLVWQRQHDAAFYPQAAELDLMSAELALARARRHTEFEAAELYFQLLDAQQAVEKLNTYLEGGRHDSDWMDQRLGINLASRLDRATARAHLLDLEMGHAEAMSRRRLAALRLAEVLGAETDAETLIVEEPQWVGALAEKPLLALDNFTEQALERRSELRLLRERISLLAGKLPPSRRFALDSLAAGYAHIGDAPGGVGIGTSGFLLGGHTGRGDLNLRIPLRKTGHAEAYQQMLSAKILLLALDLDRAEQETRHEVSVAHALVQASGQKVRIADRRLASAAEALEVTTERFEHGLEGWGSVRQARLELLRAEGLRAQSNAALMANLVKLLSCADMLEPAGERTSSASGR